MLQNASKYPHYFTCSSYQTILRRLTNDLTTGIKHNRVQNVSSLQGEGPGGHCIYEWTPMHSDPNLERHKLWNTQEVEMGERGAIVACSNPEQVN